MENHDEITDISMLDKDKLYTYDEYYEWKFDDRVELIKGKIFEFISSPPTNHQMVSGHLSYEFLKFFKQKQCEVYCAPFDVRLPVNESDFNPSTVVQPDISVICDKRKLDERGCVGAPDFIVEILSPITASKDVKDKFDLYKKHGVKEYWIVDPENRILDIFTLENEKYRLVGKFISEQTVSPVLFPDLKIDLSDIFDYGTLESRI